MNKILVPKINYCAKQDVYYWIEGSDSTFTMTADSIDDVARTVQYIAHANDIDEVEITNSIHAEKIKKDLTKQLITGYDINKLEVTIVPM